MKTKQSDYLFKLIVIFDLNYFTIFSNTYYGIINLKVRQ